MAIYNIYWLLLDALIDFKSVLDTILLLQLLWYSRKTVEDTSLTVCFTTIDILTL